VVYLDRLTCINLYRSAQLTTPLQEQQPAWAKPVNSFPVFINHGWVEPDETISDQILIELRNDHDVGYRLELYVRSRQPSFRERFESWRKRKASGGTWSTNSVAEEEKNEDKTLMKA